MKHLKIPKGVKITSRSSTINSQFVKSIIPDVVNEKITYELVEKFLRHTESGKYCSYCGVTEATEWDHFRPSVQNGIPTGYGTDPYNLVPSCGKCNQSKGSKHWEEWILGNAPLSPNTKCVPQLNDIVKSLNEFEKYTDVRVTKIVVDGADINEFFEIRDEINKLLIKAQSKADRIKKRLK